jgi:hypothetical protein
MRDQIRGLAERVRHFLLRPLLEREPPRSPVGPDAATQLLLALTYRRLAAEGNLPGLSEAGFKAYSQTDEDGLLWYIFSLIGARAKSCVEICAGDGTECNTANLILNHGWTGLLVDGNQELVERGRLFYRASPQSYVDPPQFICAWVTRGNVNQLLTEHGWKGEIDLLSIDVDGVDYWLWEAIEEVTPRVVVVEYQDILGPERSWTVPYADDFSADRYPKTDGMPNFAGASLAAMVKLGRRKGYRLVGCNRYGYNAFFVRDGTGEAELPRVEARACFTHPKVIRGMRERFPTVKDLPWVEV